VGVTRDPWLNTHVTLASFWREEKSESARGVDCGMTLLLDVQVRITALASSKLLAFINCGFCTWTIYNRLCGNTWCENTISAEGFVEPSQVVLPWD